MMFPKKPFFFFAGSAVFFLLIADIALKMAAHYSGHHYMGGLVLLFDLHSEGNIPTWFSSSLLLAAAYLLWRIGSAELAEHRPYAMHWRVLAFIFAFLSMDETASIHDRSSSKLNDLWNTSGLFRFAWVIPAMVLLCVLLACYVGFLKQLPRSTKKLVIAAGGVYVGAALGLECAEGLIATTLGKSNLVFTLTIMLEEVAEMTGVLIFIYALMGYEQDRVQ